VLSDLGPWLSIRTIRSVWGERELLRLGLSFSLPTLFVLLCHELGHWLACRRHNLPATPPFFLPAPIGLGTFGAFIRIRAPIEDRRQLLDVGASGPLAGFVALLPFLVLGVLWSQPAVIDAAGPGVTTDVVLWLPGQSLLLQGLTLLVHGPLGPQATLDLHPFALAAWVGLLVTALNLLPLGQLDGGHILYAAVGRSQARLAPWLWGLLAAAGVLLWPGWFLWSVITLAMGLRHPPVLDENQPLDRRRRLLAWAALVVLVLCFVPVPLQQIPVAR
jgi:membrane-associated protease RseP (regulator of RpoE activity)